MMSPTELFASAEAGKAHKKSGITLDTFFSSLVYAVVLFVVQLVLFCMLRKRFRRIYEPRTFLVPKSYRATAVGDGFVLDWIVPLATTPLGEILNTSGMDAYYLLRYILVGLYVFVGSGLIILPVLLPINATGSVGGMPTAEGLDRLSWTNISPQNTRRYSAQFTLALCFLVGLYWTVRRELESYVHARQKRLLCVSHRSKPSASTVLVRNLPFQCTRENISQAFCQDISGGIERIWVNRNFSKLERLVKRRRKVLTRLESSIVSLIHAAHAAQEQNPRERMYQTRNEEGDNPRELQISAKDQFIVGNLWKSKLNASKAPSHRRFSGNPLRWVRESKVDSISWFKSELLSLNRQIEDMQKFPQQFPESGSCFIQFKDQITAHLVSQSSVVGIPGSIMAVETLCEVNPRSILWSNLNTQLLWVRFLKHMFVLVISLLMIVGWTFPVAFVAMVSRVEYLAQLIPFLHWLKNFPKVRWFGSGVVPVVCLSLLMALVPYFFQALARIIGATELQVEYKVQKWLFAFLFIQVFLVVSITSGVTEVLYLIIHSPTTIPGLLARDLPKASNFFFALLTVEGLTTSGNNLLQIGKLSRITWSKIWHRNKTITPREAFADLTDFSFWSWGSIYPRLTSLFTIGIVYSVISPMVLAFAGFAFAMLYLTFKYRVMFCDMTRFESYGRYFPTALYQLFCGVYCMELSLVGLFVLVRNENGQASCYPYAVGMIVALACTVYFHYRLHKDFGPALDYVPIARYGDGATADMAENEISSNDSKQSEGNAKTKANATENINEENIANQFHASTSYSGNAQSQRGKSSRSDFDTPFDQLTLDFTQLTEQQQENIVKFAYLNSAARSGRPCIWLPQDPLGIAADQVHDIQSHFPQLSASCADCWMDSRGKISFTNAPPDYDPMEYMSL